MKRNTFHRMRRHRKGTMLSKDNAEKPVQLIERKKVYDGRVVTLYDDYVSVGEHKTHWDFIHHPGAAAVLPVLEDGRLLLVRQYRHALGRYTLEVPAGKRDSEEEHFKLCAMRELEEETGFKTEDLTFLLRINTTVAFLDEVIEIFLARNLQEGQLHWDADEELGVEKWALQDVLDMIYRGEMTDSKTVSAILAYSNSLLMNQP